jgi:hypothetical protein
MVTTAMLLPGNRRDQVAARGLAQSTSGGVLLADEGYRGSDLFDWLYEEAQVLRAGAVRRLDRRPLGHQPGHPAGRKQFFRPLAPVHRSGLRPVLARAIGESATEDPSLQSGSSRYCLSTGRVNPRLRLIQPATEVNSMVVAGSTYGEETIPVCSRLKCSVFSRRLVCKPCHNRAQTRPMSRCHSPEKLLWLLLGQGWSCTPHVRCRRAGVTRSRPKASSNMATYPDRWSLQAPRKRPRRLRRLAGFLQVVRT